MNHDDLLYLPKNPNLSSKQRRRIRILIGNIEKVENSIRRFHALETRILDDRILRNNPQIEELLEEGYGQKQKVDEIKEELAQALSKHLPDSSSSNHKTHPHLIVSPPASWLVRVSIWVLGERIGSLVVSQAYHDGLEEYFEALYENNYNKAKWRHVQIYIAVLNAVITWLVTSIGKRLVHMWKLL